MESKAALIVGAGDATGGAIARRFAREGYATCVTRRHADKLRPLVAQIEAEGGKAHAFASDARKEDEVIALVEQIESTIGPIEVLVFNIGANVPESILTETARKYFKVWEMAAFSGFLNGREVAKRMVARDVPRQEHRGTILFTGATASLRGGANFGAFSGAKMALRALAQSMARELGPQGIHVAHVVIDGAIDTEFIRSNFPERYALKGQGASSIPSTSRTAMRCCTASRATPGPTSSTCDPGPRAFERARPSGIRAASPAPCRGETQRLRRRRPRDVSGIGLDEEST